MSTNPNEIKTMHDLLKVTMDRAFSDDRTFDENIFIVADNGERTDCFLLGQTAFVLEYLMAAAFRAFDCAASIGFTEDVGDEPVDFSSVYAYQLREIYNNLSRAYEENKEYEID